MDPSEVNQAVSDFCDEVVKGYSGVITILCGDEKTVVIHGTPDVNVLTMDGTVFILNGDDDTEE